VEVIAGKDLGKRGRVLRVDSDKSRVLVEHVHMIKKAVKPNPQRNIKGGIAEQEAPFNHIKRLVVGRRQDDPHRLQVRRQDEGPGRPQDRRGDRNRRPQRSNNAPQPHGTVPTPRA
jgi:large subunit ribosomal protein L24